MDQDTKITVLRNELYDHDGLRLFVHNTQNKTVAPPVELTDSSDVHDAGFRPTIQFTKEQAQKLVGDLWDLGFRPPQAAGSVGQLAATSKHLEDMRKLVFEHKGGI